MSCGLDHCIKVWDLKPCEAAIKESYAKTDPLKPFKTQLYQFPEFSSEKVVFQLA